MPYSILNLSYVTVTELYEMFDAKIDGITDQMTMLKHFQRPWIFKNILVNLPIIQNAVILSMGEGYDSTAGTISEKYKANVTVLDKYVKDEELDKTRYDWNSKLEDLKKKNPNINYVHGLAGFPQEHKLGSALFDCIYSNSVLEHIPHENFDAVLSDMDRMLKSDGIQVHTIDFPVDLYPQLIQFYKDKFGSYVTAEHRNKFAEIDLENIRANPMTYYESVDTLKRWWFPHLDRKDVKYQRWTSLNIVLKKIS